MFFGDVGDELLDDHGLTHTGTTKDTRLTTAGKGGNQVDNFDTSFKDLRLGGLFFEQRSALVDGAPFGGIYRFVKAVDGFTNDIEDATKGGRADRHRNCGTSVGAGDPTAQAVGGTHGHCLDIAVTEVLLHFGDQRTAIRHLHRDCVINRGGFVFLEFGDDYDANNLGNCPNCMSHTVPPARIVWSDHTQTSTICEGSRSRGNLRDFLGDIGLTGFVVRQGQFAA